MVYWKFDDDEATKAKKLYDIAMAYVLAHYNVREMSEEEFFLALENAYRAFAQRTGEFIPPF